VGREGGLAPRRDGPELEGLAAPGRRGPCARSASPERSESPISSAIFSAEWTSSIIRAQWYPIVTLTGLPPATALNSLRAASALGVSMKSHAFTRASGPTRYQPFSVPSDRMNKNFMYDQFRTSSPRMSKYRWSSWWSKITSPSASTARRPPS
jgi:hypothetical protein